MSRHIELIMFLLVVQYPPCMVGLIALVNYLQPKIGPKWTAIVALELLLPYLGLIAYIVIKLVG